MMAQSSLSNLIRIFILFLFSPIVFALEDSFKADGDELAVIEKWDSGAIYEDWELPPD